VDPDYATLLRHRLLRVLVTLTTFVVVWLVAHPAMAMDGAPVCDPRGAANFAPPPQFQDPEQSLDIVTNDDDCTSSPLETRHVVPRHAPPIDAPSTSQEPAAAGAAIVVPRGAGDLLPAPDACEVTPRSGFRGAVERPPRS
jgi:hypothetical protein